MRPSISIPKNAEYISSRVARYAPCYEQRVRERANERALEEFIAAQPNTRYRAIHLADGTSRIHTVSPAQLLCLWPDHVISALSFHMRWSRGELLRLLGYWNRRKSGWLYVPADDQA